MIDEYIKSSNIVFEDGVRPGIIHIYDQNIIGILPYDEDVMAKDYGNMLILPGLFDSHTHGFGGYSFTGTLNKEDVKEAMKYYASNGITMIHATTSYNGYEVIYNARNDDMACSILGIHAEGPFLNDNRFGAAKPGTKFLKPNLDTLKDIIEKGHGFIKTMTLALEVEGNKEVASYLKEHNIKVALGHSDISANEFKDNYDKVDLVTHLANAMSGIHHRDMGLLGACLITDKPCEMICDGNHICNDMLKIIFKCKDTKELMMISDSTALAGLKEGYYPLISGAITLTKDGFMLNEFNHIAGSSKSILYGIKYLYHNMNLRLNDIVNMASLNPCKFYGYHDLGKIDCGYKANLVIVDNEFNVFETYKNGVVVYNKDSLLVPNPNLDKLMDNEEFMNFYK